MITIEKWDEKVASSTLCVAVHVFAPQNESGALMYYMSTEYNPNTKGIEGLDTTPRPCGSVEEAVQVASNVAVKNGINLVLVDDNRSE